MSETSAILCKGVTKTFREEGSQPVPALRGVDLEARSGELLLLVGPSGCGKTTLISVIAGLLDPDEGEVEVFGVPIDRLPPRERTSFRGKNVGFVFQQYNLLPTLTAAENVAVPLLIQRVPRKEALARARAELDLVGLGERADSAPRQLSGGQQQRVAIARALVASPRLLVCDEPTASLDGQTGHHVMELLRQVAVKGDRCVLVVSHDPRVYGFGDRIAEMLDGRIVGVREVARA
jgi:putative ABC transport system ATP-binding protein